MAVLETVVGRQPVFDREFQVIGYELLFRSLFGEDAGADQTTVAPDAGVDGDLMTSLSSVSMGVTRLVGDKVVFWNAERDLLVGVEPVVLPPNRTVIAVQPSVEPDDEVLAGCKRLVKDGFLIALDHYTGSPASEPLLELASLVKLDAGVVAPSELPKLIERCGSANARPIANWVETSDQLERYEALGFDLFQGYLLSRPRFVPGRSLDPSSLGRLRLAATLVGEECSAERLEEIVKTEPTMAYQLLEMAGVGAEHGLRRNVRSLREAIVMVGWRQLQSWIALLLLTHRGTTSGEEVVTTLTRAKMCELLMATQEPRQAGFAFTAGLLSSFDLLLGLPLEEVLLSMPLDAELHDAVLRHDTELGRIVADVVDYQLGRPEEALRSGIEETELHKAATRALTWGIFVSSGLTWPTRTSTRLRPGGPPADLARRRPGPPRPVRIVGS